MGKMAKVISIDARERLAAVKAEKLAQQRPSRKERRAAVEALISQARDYFAERDERLGITPEKIKWASR